METNDVPGAAELPAVTSAKKYSGFSSRQTMCRSANEMCACAHESRGNNRRQLLPSRCNAAEINATQTLSSMPRTTHTEAVMDVTCMLTACTDRSRSAVSACKNSVGQTARSGA